jgi:hypothetical protein
MAGLSPTYWAFTCKSLWDHVPYSFIIALITRGCYSRRISGLGSKELGLSALCSYYGKLKRRKAPLKKESNIVMKGNEKQIK